MHALPHLSAAPKLRNPLQTPNDLIRTKLDTVCMDPGMPLPIIYDCLQLQPRGTPTNSIATIHFLYSALKTRVFFLPLFSRSLRFFVNKRRMLARSLTGIYRNVCAHEAEFRNILGEIEQQTLAATIDLGGGSTDGSRL